MNIGLFFGSFNPIHNGHLAIANYIVEFTNLDELWFVISPQNPLKSKSGLLADYQRLEMVSRAIEEHSKFRASNIEFSMPKPSYTIDTLTYLKEKHPDHNFSLIMGQDNIATIHKWKNFELILEKTSILVYPRPNILEGKYDSHPSVEMVFAPQMEISSSFIRKTIAQGKELPYFMHPKAYKYMREMHFYEKIGKNNN